MKAFVFTTPDESDLTRQVVALLLEHEGLACERFSDLESLSASLGDCVPALVVTHGYCDQIRESGFEGPLVVLGSPMPGPRDEITAFYQGADDWIRQPFDPAVFAARVRVSLKRQKPGWDSTVQAGALTLDSLYNVAQRNGTAVQLTPTESNMLKLLMLGWPRPVTRDVLEQALWNGSTCANAVDVYIRRLRKKLEAHPDRPEHILTVRGVGYKLA